MTFYDFIKGWLSIIFFGTGVIFEGWNFVGNTSVDRPKDMKSVIAKYRKNYERKLNGYWYSYLGGGEEMAHGIAIDFRKNGTGKITRWDNILGLDDTDEPQKEQTFRWQSIGVRSIHFILESGEESVVSYDFKARNMNMAFFKFFYTNWITGEKII